MISIRPIFQTGTISVGLMARQMRSICEWNRGVCVYICAKNRLISKVNAHHVISAAPNYAIKKLQTQTKMETDHSRATKTKESTCEKWA